MNFDNWNHQLPAFWNHPDFPTKPMRVDAFSEFLGSVDRELLSILIASDDATLIDVASIKSFIRCLPIVGLHDYTVVVTEGSLTLYHHLGGTRVAYYFGDKIVGYKISKRTGLSLKSYHVGKFYPTSEASIPDVVRTFEQDFIK